MKGSVAFAQASFEGLGDLPGGLFESSALGVSADGLVVVGQGASDRCVQEAFRWENNVMMGLGDLNAIQCQSSAMGVSADGSVVVGRGLSQDPNAGFIRTEAFRWTASGGMVGLGDLPGSVFGSQGFGVSADGSVFVGRGESTSGQEAFRWESGLMTGLDDLPGGEFKSDASDASGDGSVVVGRGETASGEEAFRWENNIMTPLGFPSGSNERGLGPSQPTA